MRNESASKKKKKITKYRSTVAGLMVHNKFCMSPSSVAVLLSMCRPGFFKDHVLKVSAQLISLLTVIQLNRGEAFYIIKII